MLFVTGYASGKLLAGVEVIGKPFALDELARRVEALLAVEPLGSDRNPYA